MTGEEENSMKRSHHASMHHTDHMLPPESLRILRGLLINIMQGPDRRRTGLIIEKWIQTLDQMEGAQEGHFQK